ncbi:hypothetical protein [Crenobacter cavernae]|uniref:hypothetical protein n=1 Tax=Crenobacter cavernae TaxID=2290923 RepID=UPI001C69907B|nr:hypothetical protein [Crenobacter cavernae]
MKTLLSWSSGKDSAWALFVLRETMPDYDVVGLFCTVNAEYDRVAMHAPRRAAPCSKRRPRPPACRYT